LPVALDDVLRELSSAQAQHGVQSAIGQTDATLRQGGSDAIRALAADAPATLNPAGVVLEAFRGTNPDSDLTQLVTGLESLADAMNQTQGQFSSTVASLDRTSLAFGAGSSSLSQAIAIGPDTLRTTRAGLGDLKPTLGKLEQTSEDFRPSAKKLDSFLHEFGPVLHRSRPVISDLRDVMEDARPLLDELVSTADVGNDTIDDVKGPVFDRINGPIKDRIYANFVGKNEYKNGSVPIPTYQEVGYLLSGNSNVWKHYDANDAIARLEAGAGGNSIGGTKFPMSVEEYLETFGLQQPMGPNPAGRGPIPRLGKADPSKAHPGQAVPDVPQTASIPLLGGSR
jgi:phospholipid/cholesterol/gamma-HCH transport system substrate-binding protein